MAVLLPASDAVSSCAHDHAVALYEDEAYLAETVAAFLVPALRSGDAAIVIARPEHRALIEARVMAAGVDIDSATAEGRYVAADARDMLAAFMGAGGPEQERFDDVIGAALAGAGGGRRSVRAYGEMVSLLWEDGDVASALALEDFWNELRRHHEFELLCAYPVGVFDDPTTAEAFQRMCEQHSDVTPAEDFARSEHPGRAAAELQREVMALRGDLRRLQRQRDHLVELAYVDSLTGLANRRAFDAHLEREWALAQRDGIDSFVLVADLDGFKALNDHHGHAAGDEALCLFARTLREAARRTDVVARLGGDEFGVLFVRGSEHSVNSFSGRLTDAIARRPWPAGRRLGVSSGSSSLARAESATRALDRADLAMLAGKRATR